MKLDFEPSNGNYIIRAPRNRKTEMIKQYGLDFWPAASTVAEGCFSTVHAYAAAPFWQYATPRAQSDRELQWICREIDASRALDDGGHYKVPDDKELSGYQKADLAYMLRRDGHALDADEPGLGKTPTAIAYANEIGARKTLIIVPAAIRYQWLERWREWSTGREVRGSSGVIVHSKRGVPDDQPVIIVSYDLAGAAGLWDAMMKMEYDLLILDEAHFLKTPSAARTKAIFGGALMKRDDDGHEILHRDYGAGLASRCRHILSLTGTPLPNRPAEAYVQARNLCHASIDYLSERAFKEMYNPISTKEIRVYDAALERELTKIIRDEDSGRHAELQARLRAHFMCRHTEDEVGNQKRRPVYDLVRADLTREDGAAIKAALHAESLLGIDPDDLSGQHVDVIGHIAVARRMMGIALAPQAAEYARALLTGGVRKLTIFYWHIEVGDMLQRALGDFGVCRVDGSSSAAAKEGAKRQFLTDPTYRVMMGNHLSLGTGTDGLQSVSSYCLIAEPDWVPGNNEQCVKRLDRRGQAELVNADIVVAPGSIAEKVLGSALRKRRVTHNSLDNRL